MKWAGLLFRQPGGDPALGSQLQVNAATPDGSEPDQKAKERIEALVRKANEGTRRDRRKLFRELDRKQITIKASLRPTLATAAITDLVVMGAALKGFEMESAKRSPLLVYK
jgi:hypothetical protein